MVEKEPKTICPCGLPHGALSRAAFTAHQVNDGETLVSLAKTVGWTWLQLARFNWGTINLAEVAWYLHYFVGCHPVTKKGYNHPMAATDSPGVIFLPSATAKPSVSRVPRKPPTSKKRATVSAGPMKLKVIELSFHDDCELTRWIGKSLITGPVWKSAPKRNLPVCYKKNSNGLKLQVKVKVVSGETDKPITLRAVGLTRPKRGNPKKLRGLSAPLIFEKDNVTVTTPSFDVNDITLVKGRLSDRVLISEVVLRWSYSHDKKTWYRMFTTGPHKIYQVADTPLENPLYTKALEKACGYVNGQTDVAGFINKGLRADKQTPRYVPGADLKLSKVLSTYGKKKCQCTDYAKLMHYLCRSVGLVSSLVYMWGGTGPTNCAFYLTRTKRKKWVNLGVTITKPHILKYGCTFQVTAPKNGAAQKDPHFKFHAMTKYGGTTYDPTYGKVSSRTITCHAPSASAQFGGRNDWLYGSDTMELTWSCPH
ncbi:MAG: hypothetical protein PVJ57_04670 [Phycisphaerae bacterium]|jgi:hypothetical protein